jgi:thioesterase domain-containing protein
LRSREPEVRFCEAADRGWTGMFADGLEIHEILDNHTTMLCEPHVQEVGRQLDESLRAAQQSEERSDAKN